MNDDPGSVGGDGEVCPVAVEWAGKIGEELGLVGHAGLVIALSSASMRAALF